MDIRYTNLIQFIVDVQNDAKLNQIVNALWKLSLREIENLRIEYNVLGQPLYILAGEMLKEFEKKAK